MSMLDGFFSIFKDENKLGEGEQQYQSIGERMPELKLDLDDKEILDLTSKWTSNWNKYIGKIKKDVWDENENYWKGEQYNDISSENELMDNRIFMATETFLPIASRQNPEAVVEGDNTDEGQRIALTVTKHLAHQANIQRLKLKLKTMMRYWILYQIGVAKVGWDLKNDDLITKIINPKNIILDPNATIEEGQYTGDYVGHVLYDSVSTLKSKFKNKKEFFDKITNKNDGTKLRYVEWWTNEYVCWILEGTVLDKAKNPHWNYEENKTEVDEMGLESVNKIKGKNHFVMQEMPFIFFSIFNIGLHPIDDTGLIQQNKSLQDLINKRLRQIDKNIDNQNNSLVSYGLTKDQAKDAARAIYEGGIVNMPDNESSKIDRMNGTPLTSDVFTQLQDARNEVDNIFGTHSVTRGEQTSDQTVGGKIMAKSSDESRIGGGIGEFLEEFADKIFNWWVQLMYVYYDEKKLASEVGVDTSKEYYELSKNDFNNVIRLSISVKSGSLIPKDPLTERNIMVDLWNAGAVSILDLYNALERPNPKEMAKRWYLQQNDPAQLVDIQPQQQIPPNTAPVENPQEGGVNMQM